MGLQFAMSDWLVPSFLHRKGVFDPLKSGKLIISEARVALRQCILLYRKPTRLPSGFGFPSGKGDFISPNLWPGLKEVLNMVSQEPAPGLPPSCQVWSPCPAAVDRCPAALSMDASPGEALIPFQCVGWEASRAGWGSGQLEAQTWAQSSGATLAVEASRLTGASTGSHPSPCTPRACPGPAPAQK